MPTIFHVLGYAVVIYTHDHRPAHIHVIGPDGRCVFNLNCPGGPLEEREHYGIPATRRRQLRLAIEPEIRSLCAHWRKFHGNY